jgi:hypothetical protein
MSVLTDRKILAVLIEDGRPMKLQPTVPRKTEAIEIKNNVGRLIGRDDGTRPGPEKVAPISTSVAAMG